MPEHLKRQLPAWIITPQTTPQFDADLTKKNENVDWVKSTFTYIFNETAYFSPASLEMTSLAIQIADFKEQKLLELKTLEQQKLLELDKLASERLSALESEFLRKKFLEEINASDLARQAKEKQEFKLYWEKVESHRKQREFAVRVGVAIITGCVSYWLTVQGGYAFVACQVFGLVHNAASSEEPSESPERTVIKRTLHWLTKPFTDKRYKFIFLLSVCVLGKTLQVISHRLALKKLARLAEIAVQEAARKAEADHEPRMKRNCVIFSGVLITHVTAIVCCPPCLLAARAIWSIFILL